MTAVTVENTLRTDAEDKPYPTLLHINFAVNGKVGNLHYLG